MKERARDNAPVDAGIKCKNGEKRAEFIRIEGGVRDRGTG